MVCRAHAHTGAFLSLQFDLSATLVGFVFLLMSAFYAISSPIWGWVADRMVSSVAVGLSRAKALCVFKCPLHMTSKTFDEENCCVVAPNWARIESATDTDTGHQFTW